MRTVRSTATAEKPFGARVERFLRVKGYQTDRLTLSIARNQQSLERFARRYGLDSLLTPQARAAFAAMSRQECGHFIEFLQLSIHAGRKSLRTRQRWLSERGEPGQILASLAAVVDRPQLVEGRARAIFQSMSPEAQRMAAAILLAAWQAARRSPSLQDVYIKLDVVDRMVEQLEGGTKPVSSARAARLPSG